MDTEMTDDSHKPADIFTGVKFALVAVACALAGLSQAVFGWAGNSMYLRVVYPFLALLAAGAVGLFAYALLNQPALRRKEAEAKARKAAQEGERDLTISN